MLSTLASTFSNPYQSTSTTASSSSMMVFVLLFLTLLVVGVIGNWKLFEKAGQKGWKILIPVYNYVILCRIVGISGWFAILLCIPYVNFIAFIYVSFKLAKSFGKGIGVAILNYLYVGILILGFGSAKYVGPGGQPEAKTPNSPGSEQIPQAPHPQTPVAPAA